MSDYLLGNGHSLAADRRLAAELERAVPDIRTIVQLGRMFLRSAVTYLMRAGIRQFVKFGSDMPTVGNVHTVAQAVDPECRVVYVDTDPIAVAHSRMLLADNERTAAVQVQRSVDDLAERSAAERLLDKSKPMGVLAIDVLRSWDPPSLLAGCADRLAPGSHLAIAHLTADHRPAETAALVDVMRASDDPVQPRTRDEIAGLFEGFELVGPGVTDVGKWYDERALTPVEQAAASQFSVGIGRKAVPESRSP